MEQKLYYARNFGAVGDGIHDDGPALSRAFREAAQNEGKLILEEGKTYNIVSAENKIACFETPFAIQHCRNFALDGQGSVISVRPGMSYLAIVDCEDFTIENLHFDLSAPVYYVGTVLAVDGNEVTYATDTKVGAERCAFNGQGFTIRWNEGVQDRPHRFFSEMVRLEDYKVKVIYRGEGGYAVGDTVFLPAMYIGHMIGEPVYIAGNAGKAILRNIDLWQAPSFCCAVKGNSADITFERFNLVPSPRYDHKVKMMGWRDGFHCKDNRGALHWENCTVGVIFDDVFNISATLGEVLEVLSPRKLVVVNQEFYRHQNRIINFYGDVGDEVEFYHTAQDIYGGLAKIVATETDEQGRSLITLDRDLEKVSAGFVVGNRSNCAPGSTVKNCDLTGTLRFRGPCTVEDTKIDMLRMWLMVEGDVEGPIPCDIRFRNCVFNGGGIEVWGYNRPEDIILPNLGQEIKNIVFEDCQLNCRFDMATNIVMRDSRVK